MKNCLQIIFLLLLGLVQSSLGTPYEAYDEKGEKIWACELDVYGKVRTFEGEKNFIPFRYQGQYEDEETGLYYNRFRYYSPDSGTFISQDPISIAGGLNVYAYVNDTNSWGDVFGLNGCDGVRKGKKRGPKTKEEGGPHNDKIGEIAKKLEDDGWVIREGGNRRPEQLHKTGGLKNRRPDILATEGGKTKIVNVGKKGRDGLPIKREQQAIDDLKNIFDDVEFEPYN